MIYLGADHNGFELKERAKSYLAGRHLAFVDLGAATYKRTDDYPDFARSVGGKLKRGDIGILFCGSGHGMVIAANKLKGVRAIMPLSEKSARDGRRDDHANICVIAAWESSTSKANKIISAFLGTKPGKHKRYLRRLKKIAVLEK